MGTRYEQDVVAWASEQAALLRAGNLSVIDIEHIAEEIADVGKVQRYCLPCTHATRYFPHIPRIFAAMSSFTAASASLP